jgi:transcriptional regulator with XRE-family HTH domain
MTELDGTLARMDRSLTNLGSKARGTDIILSAPQVRAARSLLGWSRRELAIVSGVSSGTIKAIEHGLTDPRLSTLRKLARTFKAHSVEFVFEGRWTGVVISTPSVADQPKGDRILCSDEKPAASLGTRVPSREDETKCDRNRVDTTPQNKPQGYHWLKPLRRAKRA